MAKRRSVDEASKYLFAAMKQTADDDDREGFELVLQLWEPPLTGEAKRDALLAWDAKRREIERRRDQRGAS